MISEALESVIRYARNKMLSEVSRNGRQNGSDRL